MGKRNKKLNIVFISISNYIHLELCKRILQGSNFKIKGKIC